MCSQTQIYTNSTTANSHDLHLNFWLCDHSSITNEQGKWANANIKKNGLTNSEIEKRKYRKNNDERGKKCLQFIWLEYAWQIVCVGFSFGIRQRKKREKLVCVVVWIAMTLSIINIIAIKARIFNYTFAEPLISFWKYKCIRALYTNN